ncbi:MAG: HD-GYP domain-containing protein [Thermoleophilaceae bacterium]|nr:HD-GYP domain-containing protein [Thermoleophilaceae bacterium]
MTISQLEPMARTAPPKHPFLPHLIPAYVGVLCTAAVTLAVLAPHAEIGRRPVLFALLGAFALTLNVVPIDLFERGKTSPAGIPLLAVAYLFGAPGAAACEAAMAAVTVLRGGGPLRALHDFGSLSLVAASAAGVMQALPGESRTEIVVAAGAGGMVYYLANSAALGAIWLLDEGVNPLVAWRERMAWLWPHQLACGLLAGGLVISINAIGSWAVAAFALPVFMLWVAQKQYLDHSRESARTLRKQAQALEEANAELREALAQNEALIENLHRSYLSTIESLARTIEAKDPYTGGHTERVADLSLMLARELGFNAEELRAVQVGAIIHDIGKIGIPDQILLKPGPLTDEEAAEMRRHPEISTYILAELELPKIVKAMVRHHHERYDGDGYPDGLAGEDIPLAARILTVADALDAMISDRPYRAALSLSEARAEIERNAGSQFCPRVVEALGRCLERDPGLLQLPSGTLAPEPAS